MRQDIKQKMDCISYQINAVCQMGTLMHQQQRPEMINFKIEKVGRVIVITGVNREAPKSFACYPS
jgi:hypothetical protein